MKSSSSSETLEEHDYDDSPWTREELECLAWETGTAAHWNEMAEYDDIRLAEISHPEAQSQ